MNIETLKQLQLPTIKSQHLVTGLAGVFALVSVQGTAHFFVDLHHPVIASWTLGVAIGCALVTLAHLLSEIDPRERKAFFGLLSVTLILVVLSSIIQGIGYAKELGTIGYLLAFVLVSTGEIVLPLAHSWHHEAKRRQAVNDAGQRVEEIAAETMIGTMENVNTDKAQRQAERQIERLIVAHVKNIVEKLMPDTAVIDAAVYAAADISPVISTDGARPTLPNGAVGATVAEMHAARRGKADSRRAAILDAVAGQDVVTFTAEQAAAHGITERTIRDDIRKLERSGEVIANGVIIRAVNYEPA